MDLELICKNFYSSDITDVSVENSFFIELYNKQKELLQKTLKARYLLEQLKRTNSQNPVLDSFFFYYDKSINIKTGNLTIEINTDVTESNQFVDKEYIDVVISNKYQKENSISSYIYQQIINDDTDTSKDILLTTDYFLASFFNTIKKTITNSTVVNKGFNNKESNEIVGLIEASEVLIKKDDIIPLNTYVLKSANVTVTYNSIETTSIEISSSDVKEIYCTDSNYLINNINFKKQFITYDNLYLNDNALINDVLKENTNMVKVIDLITMLGNTKAPKSWNVPYLIKTDSGETKVSDKITQAVANGEEIDTDEPISYEEFINSVNSILDKVYSAIGEC